MDKNEMINAEKNELDRLLKNGLSFEVDRKVRVKKDGILGYVGKTEFKTETLKFFINEPTLSTLDRIASEQTDLVIDENVMKSEIGVQQAKVMAKKYGKKLAKIIAFAVLGQDYLIQMQSGSKVIYKNDDKELNRLTDLFYYNIQPSKLLKLAIIVNNISNLGDFTNSIRLMSANRTTMPILIEEKTKG